MSALQLSISGFITGCGFAALVMSIVSGYNLASRCLSEV